MDCEELGRFWFVHEFPPVLAEGSLLAFPRGSQIAECVMAELLG